MSTEENLRLVQIGMRAVIHDIRDFVEERKRAGSINVQELQAYLLGCLITAGGYDDRGQG